MNDRNAEFLAGCSERAQMNALLDALRTLRLSGGIFLDCEFSAPWCVTASSIGPEEVGLLTMPFPAHVIAYHYVTQGGMLLQMANQEPIAIGAGDTLCHPKSPAAIGFLTKASQVNRTVLRRNEYLLDFLV